jgi:membrane-bound serine protease (ClpP class)
VTLVVFIVISLLLPSPWNVVALACGVVLEVGEIVWGRRLARRMRPKTGAEALIGREARVVEACRPDGYVRVGGERWRAICADGADAGDAVRVTAVRELTLDVAPVEPAPRNVAAPDGERPGSRSSRR